MRSTIWRRILPALATLTLVVTAAFAATSGAHFFTTNGSVDSSGALVVTWDEAGLGNQNVSYTLTTNATATYACINGGGNHPKASNKETVAGQLSTGGSFQSRNGRVEGTLVTGPLSAGGFTCPSGQTMVLACVSYTNSILTDVTNSVSAAIGDVSRTFVAIKGC